jgi:hypothetical protein
LTTWAESCNFTPVGAVVGFNDQLWRCLMAKDFSKYQQKVIKNYYDNRDTIALQALGEVISEIYLAEPGMKRKKMWDRAIRHLEALKVKETTWRPIVEEDSPAKLAKLLLELQAKE